MEFKNILRYIVLLRPAKATGDFASRKKGGGGALLQTSVLRRYKVFTILGVFLDVCLLLPEIWYLREPQILLLEAA